MKITYRILAIFLCLKLCTSAYAGSVHDNVRAFMGKEQFNNALKLINKHLKNESDIDLLLTKGVIFAEIGETERAKDIFKQLIGLRPDLPEAYNNLAVIYAEKGDYNEAEFLIKKAIHTNSSYAIAQKNLTEIYAREASMAYSKALELGKNNDSTSSKKLILISNFSSLNKNKVARSSKKRKLKITDKSSTKQDQKSTSLLYDAKLALIENQTSERKSKESSAIKSEKTIPEKMIAESKEGSSQKSAMILKDNIKISANIGSGEKKEHKLIIETIKGWAKSWSSQNIGQYLSYYSTNFSPIGLSRSAWEKNRILRLSKPRFIKIEIDNVEILSISNKKAKVKFTQEYESDTYKDKAKKILLLEKNQSYWWIIGEQSADR